jgi:WD40 repeat protein
VVRSIEQAHVGPIVCATYSQRLSIVFTSGQDNCCHLWDFQTARNATISIRSTREISCIVVS